MRSFPTKYIRKIPKINPKIVVISVLLYGGANDVPLITVIEIANNKTNTLTIVDTFIFITILRKSFESG